MLAEVGINKYVLLVINTYTYGTHTQQSKWLLDLPFQISGVHNAQNNVIKDLLFIASNKCT
jgi:hypothetical protein